VITQLIDYQTFCGATSAMHPDEVTVHELKRALDDPQLGIQVLDVREPSEYQIARIDGARLFPMSTLPQRIAELDPNRSYYLHCHSGGRSLTAVRILRERGFQHLKSVKGGITAWSDEIDRTVPKY
jgi:adenylyltransferase/sulfurtransferase